MAEYDFLEDDDLEDFDDDDFDDDELEELLEELGEDDDDDDDEAAERRRRRRRRDHRRRRSGRRVTRASSRRSFRPRVARTLVTQAQLLAASRTLDRKIAANRRGIGQVNRRIGRVNRSVTMLRETHDRDVRRLRRENRRNRLMTAISTLLIQHPSPVVETTELTSYSSNDGSNTPINVVTGVSHGPVNNILPLLLLMSGDSKSGDDNMLLPLVLAFSQGEDGGGLDNNALLLLVALGGLK